MLNNPQRKKIFISYRVNDTAADTGRLVDSLKQVFYEDQIFMDIEKLEPGVDFRVALAKSLETCDVLFAVIGPEWVGVDKNGNPRIKHPEDWVRIELETALKRDIRVIPVLVRDASLPQPEELPESLYPLLNRQTYEISNKRWKYDTDQLINFLKQIGFKPKKQDIPLPEQSGGIGKWLIYGLIGLALVVIAALMFEATRSTKAQEKNITDHPVTRDSIKPVNNDKPNSNIMDKDPETVKEENLPALPANVGGAWYDAANQYTMYITQSGNTLELKSVTVAGITTGEGVGTVDGNKINFKVQLYNVGVISGSATVPEDNNVLNGKFIITNNGASYTEPFYWTRQ
ncbi:MAG: toll/interleukin-1 receptor domain-containing protein [Chitinophagaceae bacterium]|nr:toll/interleukin-1 receptor domain-containing protein [Chitinophagaceae bacterium]